MFGFSWAEIGVIMAVALVVIGPKDLPIAIRSMSAALRKMRSLASEFQGHINELMREADLHDVASELRNLRNFDLGAAVERHIDPEGDLRHALDPVTDATSSPQTGVMTQDEHLSLHEAVDDTTTTAVPAGLPDFIPPAAARQRQIPAFIPPGTRIW